MRNSGKVLRQLLAATAASMAFFMTGVTRAWSSPGIPSIQASGDIALDEEAVAWICSLPPIGSLTAALLSGPSLEKLGRRKTMLLTALPWAASFLMIGFSTSTPLLYAARVLMGATIGFSVPAAQIYISECSSPRIRGALGSLTALFLAGGILVTYIIGAFVKWDVLAFIVSAFSGIFLILMWFMPESPVWLIANGKDIQAQKALRFLRGPATDISTELERIQENFTRSSHAGTNPSKTTCAQVDQPATTGSFWRDIIQPSAWRPLFLSMTLMFFQQFSGINVVIYYTVFIFQSAGSTIHQNLATILVGIVQFVCTFLAMFVVDRYGRRPLLLTSGLIMGIALSSMGSYFYLRYQFGEEDWVVELGWLPLVSLMVFVVGYSAGYSNVPYLVMGEILPARFRNLFGAVSTSFNLSCLFVLLFTFPLLIEVIGQHGIFWLYAGVCFASVIFVFFLLPETKGKTLEDIENMFGKRRSVRDDVYQAAYSPACIQEPSEVN